MFKTFDFSPKLDFSDVLIVPQRSNVVSRANVNVLRDMQFKNSRQKWRGFPVISSNMDTVTDINTARLLRERKMLSCFPKMFNRLWVEYGIPDDLNYVDSYVLSVGIKEDDVNTLSTLMAMLVEKGIYVKFICVDVANGYMSELVRTCAKLRVKWPNVTIIAGNVVTPTGVKDLVVDGFVDVVKVGIGSGQLCTTRKITGIGYPQFSAVLECAEKAHELGAHIISDGGITYVGDINKAICAGADFVMLGSMLIGHDESPGKTIEEDGKQKKIAYGMSSRVANIKYANGLGKYKAPEGKSVRIPMRGPLNNTLQKIEGGVRSGCSYVGAKTLEAMQDNAHFIIVNNQYNASLDVFTSEE